MAIEPKTTREHILSLYGHISGVKKIKTEEDTAEIQSPSPESDSGLRFEKKNIK